MSIGNQKLSYLFHFNRFLADDRVTDEERMAAVVAFEGVLSSLSDSPLPFLQAWKALGNVFQEPGEQEDTAMDVFAGHMMPVYVTMERRAREAGVQEW